MCYDVYLSRIISVLYLKFRYIMHYYLKYNILEHNNIILNNIVVDFIKTVSRTDAYRRDHSSLRILWQRIQFKIDT